MIYHICYNNLVKINLCVIFCNKYESRGIRMKLNFNCMVCNVRQAVQIVELFKVKEEMMRKILEYLSNADYSKCNPEIIGGT